MPWLVLPMRYATIVPQYAIDRLLTTDLDVNLLWMQTKCDASLDSSFPMLMLLGEDANAIFYLWCKCPMQGWKCKVYSWCCQCMHSNHDVNVSLQRWRCQCLLMGMSWCKLPLVGMQWCKCSNTNINYSKIPFIFKIKAFSVPKTNIFSNFDLLFPKSHLFFFT